MVDATQSFSSYHSTVSVETRQSGKTVSPYRLYILNSSIRITLRTETLGSLLWLQTKYLWNRGIPLIPIVEVLGSVYRYPCT